MTINLSSPDFITIFYIAALLAPCGVCEELTAHPPSIKNTRKIRVFLPLKQEKARHCRWRALVVCQTWMSILAFGEEMVKGAGFLRRYLPASFVASAWIC